MIRNYLSAAVVAVGTLTGAVLTPSAATAGPGPGHHGGYGGGYGSGYRGGYGSRYGNHYGHHQHRGYYGPGYGYGGYRPSYPWVSPYRPYPAYPIPVGPVVQPGFSFGLSVIR